MDVVKGRIRNPKGTYWHRCILTTALARRQVELIRREQWDVLYISWMYTITQIMKFLAAAFVTFVSPPRLVSCIVQEMYVTPLVHDISTHIHHFKHRQGTYRDSVIPGRTVLLSA